MKKIILSLVKTVLPLFLGVYLIWFFFDGMSVQSKELFYKALQEANYFWIVISLVLGFTAYVSRAYRWKYMLEPLGFQTKNKNRYHAVMIGYLVNLTIPRAGEASRSAMLYRSDGVPFSSSFGTIIAERAVDLIMLASIACLTALIGFDDFMNIKAQIINEFSTSSPENLQDSSFKWIIFSVLVIGGVLFFAMIFLVKTLRKKIMSFIQQVIQGLLAIFKCKQPLLFIGHTFLIWGCYIGMFAICFLALKETSTIPFSGILLGFIAGSLGIMLTNGGIGVYPLLVGLVVAFYIKGDVPNEAQAIGNALGMLIWASQTVLMIILGLVSLLLLPKNYTKENESISVSEE